MKTILLFICMLIGVSAHAQWSSQPSTDGTKLRVTTYVKGIYGNWEKDNVYKILYKEPSIYTNTPTILVKEYRHSDGRFYEIHSTVYATRLQGSWYSFNHYGTKYFQLPNGY